MQNLHRVTKLAGILRWITIATMVALPTGITIGLLTTPLTPDHWYIDQPVSPDVTRTQLAISLILGLISLAILMFTLDAMRKLFVAYHDGEVLTDHCARLIQRIGQGFLTLAATSFVIRPIQTVLLTFANPPGQRILAIGVNNEMIFFALSGGLIIVIGWAMGEAADAAAENRSFV
ncbi:hypothetical protein [Yoonia sp. 2307UL14-13]|uniref:hypothetical protein n=1 Tax=Yoonia sp. 2307UL14-13 TaxID=3126506 RepID=UPI003095AE4B